MKDENHSPFVDENVDKASHDTAKRLLKEFNLDAGHGAYHYAGDWFGQLDRFTDKYPVVLFDIYGYIIIASEHEMISKMEVSETIHVQGGISRRSDHVKYSHEPIGIKNYKKDLTKAQKKFQGSPKLTKLKKSRDQIEKLLLLNKDITGFQIEQFRVNQEKKLAAINDEITKIQYR